MAKTLDLDPLFLSGPQLMALKVEQVEFFLDPFIPVEGITLLHGKFGTYKTPLLLNMCRAIATGEELWGLPVKQTSPLMFIEIDSPAAVVVPRIKLIGFGDVDVDFCLGYPGFDILPGGAHNPRASAIKGRLRHQHEQKDYKVVFIDSLRPLHSLQDKESDAPNRVYRALVDLFPRAALVIIHHDRKAPPTVSALSPEAKDEKFSGSQAWANHATVVANVSHESKKTRDIALHHSKSQAGPRGSRLILRVAEDGSKIALRAGVLAEEIGFYMGLIRKEDPNMLAKDQDLRLAEMMGITPRTAKRSRLRWEKTVDQTSSGPGSSLSSR